jgi:Ca2+-binding RTX toxin-like protein
MTTQIANSPNTILTAGDDATIFSLLVGSDGSSVTAGNGANQIFAFSNDDTIVAGTGANTLLAQTSSSLISLGAGNAFVFGNNDTVSVLAPTAVVSVNGTGDYVSLGNQATGSPVSPLLFGAGNSYALGSGNFQVFDTGYGTKVNAGAGNTTVVGTTGSATIIIGNGNELIGAGGSGNNIFVGAGNSTVFSGTGNANVAAGDGNNTFVLGGSGNQLALGNGHTMAFLDGSGNNKITPDSATSDTDLYGFKVSASGGDRIDVLVAFGSQPGISGNQSINNIANYLSASFSGSDTILNANIGGSSSVFADLHGVGQQSISQLIAAHALSFS